MFEILDDNVLDYSFVLECADSGTLRDYLNDNFHKLDWTIKLRFAVQISDAILHIHKKNIIHGDIVKYPLFFFDLYLIINIIVH